MLKKIDKIKDLFDVFLFDMYGVLWDGKNVKQEFLDTAKELREMGKVVKILSNSSDQVDDYVKKWSEQGIIKGMHYDEMVTSGTVARDIFSKQEKLKFFQMGWPNKELFDRLHFEEMSAPDDADFVYIGAPINIDYEKKDWTGNFDVEKYKGELHKYKDMGKTLICCNPDLRAFSSKYEEPIIVDGSIAQYYQEIGGEVEPLGKPYPEVYDYALRDYEGDDERVLMIGDTLETDILGAISYGIKSMLVEGGITTYNMRKEGFDDIMEYIEELDIVPDYII